MGQKCPSGWAGSGCSAWGVLCECSQVVAEAVGLAGHLSLFLLSWGLPLWSLCLCLCPRLAFLTAWPPGTSHWLGGLGLRKVSIARESGRRRVASSDLALEIMWHRVFPTGFVRGLPSLKGKRQGSHLLIGNDKICENTGWDSFWKYKRQ